MAPGSRGVVSLLLRSCQQRGWLLQQACEQHGGVRRAASGATPPPPKGTAPPQLPPKPPAAPTGSASSVPEAGVASSSKLSGATTQQPPSPPRAPPPPPPPPPSPGGSKLAADGKPKSKLVSGLSDPAFIIPFLGIPSLILYYCYQVYIHAQHEDRIASVHQAIKQEREKLASRAPTEKQLQKVLTALPPQPPTPPAPKLPAPPAPAPAATPSPAPPASAAPLPPPAVPTQQQAPTKAAPAPSATQEAPDATPAPKEAAHTSASPSPAGRLHEAAEAVVAAVEKAGHDLAHAAAAAAPTAPPGAAAVGAAGAAATPALAASSSSGEGGAEAAPAATHAPPAAVPLQPSREYMPVLSSTSEPEVPPVRKGVMGVQLDLTPSGLVQFAIERGAGPGEDWAAFEARHKQAVVDAELIGRAVSQIRAWHEEEVVLLKKEVETQAKKAADTLEMAQAQAESFKHLLKQHQEMAAELRQLEVLQAEKRVTLAANKAANAERLVRSQVLDELRLEVAALSAAHEHRADQQAVSAQSHALELAVLALGEALDAGRPLQPHLGGLLQAVAGDGNVSMSGESMRLLQAAVQSLPARAVAAGVATVPQLVERLRAMKGAVNTLAMLPSPVSAEDGSKVRTGGIITHAVAALFAWLKVDETGLVRALGPETISEATGGSSISTALAAAEVLVAQGRLDEAAQTLRRGAQGSAAAAAVEAWCAEAHSRAVANQTIRLLRAHAALLAASSL